MRGFTFNGVAYKSLSDYCRATGTERRRLARLCRTYERAARDPSVACGWLADPDSFNPEKEALTVTALRDRQLARARAFKSRTSKKVKNMRIAAEFLI